MTINARAQEFAEFCSSMLGTTTAKPLHAAGDGELINGALCGALLDAFKNCYPVESQPGAPPKQPSGDPLAKYRAPEPTQ
jgi:hypothetical protein